jgi:hypothetical protein
MKKVILLLGNFTFHHFDEDELALFKEDTERKALVHRIDMVMVCDNEDAAGEMGEKHLAEGCESYLIPTVFNGEIAYEQIINEETHIEFDSYDQLTYTDDDENIKLFIDGVFAGRMKVWCDAEMDGREYVTINYNIEYLDTLKTQ